MLGKIMDNNYTFYGVYFFGYSWIPNLFNGIIINVSGDRTGQVVLVLIVLEVSDIYISVIIRNRL